ncbi:type II secretion system minor pseudopilin GspJ [Shewanella maritima]|uniref:type II secretion system minor pseudopilin GspJ n=1 Tax=Shewanella maritima TaxID=2520507 RepID=UPI0037356A1B
MCITASNANKGFTLLEMLIAISIFTMLGLAANSVLDTVMTNDETTAEFAKQLKSLQQGFGAIERDLGQMVARTKRNFEGERSDSFFEAGDNILDSDTEALSFFRLGWLNPDGMLPRGSIQSVAYVVQQERLERWYFPYPDPELGADPIKSVVIEGVLGVEYSFFIDKEWRRKVDGTQMPQAIAMEIELEGLGTIQRRFMLAKGAPAISDADDDNSGGNSSGNSSGNNSGNSNSGGNSGGSSGGGSSDGT